MRNKPHGITEDAQENIKELYHIGLTSPFNIKQAMQNVNTQTPSSKQISHFLCHYSDTNNGDFTFFTTRKVRITENSWV